MMITTSIATQANAETSARCARGACANANARTAPVIRPQASEYPAPQPRRRSGSWLWFFGVLLLILVAQCSGQLYDMIK